MSEISIINFIDNDESPINKIDSFFIQERPFPTKKSENGDEYEFNENDSHITDMVKDYCDSEDFLDTDFSEKMNDSFDPSVLKRMESFKNELGFSEQNQISFKKLLKLSSIYRGDLKQNITNFKSDLLSKLTKEVLQSDQTSEPFDRTALKGVSANSLKPQFSKLYSNDPTNIHPPHSNKKSNENINDKRKLQNVKIDVYRNKA